MTARELKLFDQRTLEAQFLRRENEAFRAERDALRVEMFEADRRTAALEADNARLAAENARLLRRVQQLTAAAAAAAANDEACAASPPDFVKPDVPARPRKRPGRPAGHPAALRPVPARVDAELDVPLPVDAAGRPCCPACHCSLSDVRGHERLVEDVVPARVVVTRYRTRSGRCAMCRRRVESRAPAQPPAADLPHAQLGLNALATAAVLRVVHRLPMRQVCRVLGDLAGLSVSAGAIARQLQRLARWLAPCRERILLALRAAPRVNADETGWRTDGKNGYLWAVTGPAHTLYHVDATRAGAVIKQLLGDAFAGTLTADFYSAYNALACPKQRCLAHLLREVAESAAKHPAFAATPFRQEAAKLVKSMLALKERWDAMADDAYTTAVCRLEDRLGRLARGAYDEPNAARLAKRMLRHERELTAFLWDRELGPTNNAAERALRPAVVARKVSGGSRSAAGAQAWATLATLMRTAGQQGRHVLEVVRQLLIDAWAGREPLALLA